MVRIGSIFGECATGLAWETACCRESPTELTAIVATQFNSRIAQADVPHYPQIPVRTCGYPEFRQSLHTDLIKLSSPHLLPA